MILSPHDTDFSYLSNRLDWTPKVALVSGIDGMAQATRCSVGELFDSEGRSFPLRQEMILRLYPPRDTSSWRVLSESLGTDVVGRGKTTEEAVNDWRHRFRATVERYLELRPFELSEEEQEVWSRLQLLIDIPRYKAKPMKVRQVGRVLRHRRDSSVTVVEWESGARERVNRESFDEKFGQFRIGQRFEAVVTRFPGTFKIERADAVRKLDIDQEKVSEAGKAIWEHLQSKVEKFADANSTPELDEKFWLE